MSIKQAREKLPAPENTGFTAHILGDAIRPDYITLCGETSSDTEATFTTLHKLLNSSNATHNTTMLPDGSIGIQFRSDAFGFNKETNTILNAYAEGYIELTPAANSQTLLRAVISTVAEEDTNILDALTSGGTLPLPILTSPLTGAQPTQPLTNLNSNFYPGATWAWVLADYLGQGNEAEAALASLVADRSTAEKILGVNSGSLRVGKSSIAFILIASIFGGALIAYLAYLFYFAS